MGGTYSLIKTVVTGETITAADRNNEHTNHINNCDFSGLGDASANVTAMQTIVDPYPGAIESLATDGLGELQRVRYLLKQLSGETQWYVDPDTNIHALATLIDDYQNPMHNVSLVATVTSKALTVSLKTNAGAIPSATDTPLLLFRDVDITSGLYVARTVTTATSVVLSDGSTLGFNAAEAGRLYVWAVDNLGVVELALSRVAAIFREDLLVSTTAEGGAGGADLANVMYSTTARTNKACRLIGYIEITTGATAGEWDNAPTMIQLMSLGVRRTGEIVQVIHDQVSTATTGTTAMPSDDSIPQNDEGDEYMSLAITPTNAANKLYIEVVITLGHSETSNPLSVALFQDTTANALAAVVSHTPAVANQAVSLSFNYEMGAGTILETTFKIRAGGGTGPTLTFNGTAAARIFGGVMASSIRITEIFT